MDAGQAEVFRGSGVFFVEKALFFLEKEDKMH